MVRSWSKVYMAALLFGTPALLCAQSFTQTHGGEGAQDGIGAMISGNGYRIAVHSFVPSTQLRGLELFTMSGSGALGSSTALPVDGRCFPQRMVPSNDGHAFVVGSSRATTGSDHDGLVMRLDQTGAPIWTTVQQSAYSQQYWGGAPLADGGVLVCGVHGENNDHDALVARFNADGSLMWSHVQQGPTDAEAYAIATDGTHIMVTGRERTFGGNDDVLYMRLTMDGTVIWSNTTGGAGHEIARAVVSLGSGTFVAAGYTNSYGSFDPETQQIRDHIYLIAFNLNGDTLWTRAIGDTQHHRQAHALAVAPDGDLVFAGEQSTSASSDVFLHRSTSNGNTIWQRTLDTGKEERILHILPLPDAFVCTGWSFGPYGRQVLFIRRNGEGY